MHRYHCVPAPSPLLPDFLPQPTSCTSLFLDQSKLYFSDICKSWRVNIYLVFLERKGGPLCPDYCTFTHSHLEAGEKSNKDCLNLFSGKYQRVCKSHFLSAPIPYFISNSMSMVIKWIKVSLFIKLEFFLRPFSRKLILQCSMGFSYPFTSTHSLTQAEWLPSLFSYVEESQMDHDN